MSMRWDRRISSPAVIFDSDRVARRSGGAGCMPRALISATDLVHSSVSVVCFPPSVNHLTIGVEYTSGGLPEKSGFFGSHQSCGLVQQANASGADVVVNNRVLTTAPGLNVGDDVHISWEKSGKVIISISGSESWSWSGQLQMPDRCSAFFGVSLADDTVVRLNGHIMKSIHRTNYSETLLHSNLFSDVVLVCEDGEIINAHRAILAAASPVFQTMLQSGMCEATEQRIRIRASEATVVEFLRHIYTGEFKPPSDAAAMLQLVHFYGMDEYASYCGELLVESLTPDTAATAAQAIGRLRCAKICPSSSGDDNFDSLWQRLCSCVAQNPDLVQSILEAFVAGSSGPSLESAEKSPMDRAPRDD